MNLKKFTLALLLSFLALFTSLYTAPLQAADNVFIVQDVKTEATAKSAVVAREIAFKRALEKSFALLTRRMVDSEQQKEMTQPSSDDIANMVLDFEITSEKSSNTSYRATYTIRYNKDNIRDFFASQSVNYTDVSGQRLLVLPFIQIQNQTALWNEQNPFLKGWQDATTNTDTLTQIIVPINDLQDMMDIKDHEALTYDVEKIKRMVSRYNAKEAVIIIASPQAGLANLRTSPVNLYIYKTDKGRPEYINTITVKPSNRKDIVQNSIVQVKRFLQEEWKRKNSVSPQEQSRLYNIVVRYDNIDQWQASKNLLEQNIGKNNITIKSLRLNEATLQIDYNGSVERLNLSLSRKGFSLRPVGAGIFEFYKEK
tara:strand:+ start:859960 stop:861066 length:1107 start_codon:yes stop_codon:yes gene_type:complete